MGYKMLAVQEASNDTTVTFTTGIDATYQEYEFRFVEITADTIGGRLTFQADIGTATTYEQTMTTTNFYSGESQSSSGTSPELAYDGSYDQGNGTADQALTYTAYTLTPDSCSGVLRLFDPSNEVYVKHFISEVGLFDGGNAIYQKNYVAGYINQTDAITRVQFGMSTGNIKDGFIYMYGVG